VRRGVEWSGGQRRAHHSGEPGDGRELVMRRRRTIGLHRGDVPAATRDRGDATPQISDAAGTCSRRVSRPHARRPRTTPSAAQHVAVRCRPPVLRRGIAASWRKDQEAVFGRPNSGDPMRSAACVRSRRGRSQPGCIPALVTSPVAALGVGGAGILSTLVG